MLYNSWTMIPNILIWVLSVPHECWCCIETFLGFLRIFNRSYVHGGAWHTMVGATFKDMCYIDGMCFAMLTPMLYISVCRKICGVIRGKGFAHVPMVSSIALD